MALISTKLHGAGDYATGLGLLVAPNLLRLSDRVSSAVLRGTGVAILSLSALTDYELGIRRRVPMPAHLAVDAATGGLLAAGALRLRRRADGVTNWLPHAVLGLGEIGGALVTARQPGDRPAAAGPAQAGVGLADDAPPTAPRGEPPAAAALASQTPPAAVVERTLEPTAPPAHEDDDVFVAREASAAAAEAAWIGGRRTSSAEDPALDPVYEAGGGDEDGWEQTESGLIENATHGDGGADPERDAFTPETEADRATATYGEPDSLPSTEVAEDAGTADDSAGMHPRPGEGESA